MAVRITNIFLLVLAVVWLARAPDWEPAIAVVGLLSALIFQEVRPTKHAKEESPDNPFDHLYSTSRARDFYGAIAKEYDARNSTFLLQTHREVIDRIKERLSKNEAWHVLDLGGGTGRQIASHFYAEGTGKWTCIDSSPNMAAEFQRNMAGVRLSTEVVIRDIDEFLAEVRGPKKYDVVLLVLVLSSLPTDPVWSRIAKVIKPGGVLIVADIEPSYTAIHPHYTVLIDDQTHALRTRPAHLAEVISKLSECGLVQSETRSVKEEQTNYSFVTVFSKPTS